MRPISHELDLGGKPLQPQDKSRSAGALLQPTGDGSSAPCGAELLSFPSARPPRRAPPHIRQSRSYRARAELRALRSAGALLQPTGDGSSAPCGAELLSFPSARPPRRAPPHIRQSRSYRARAELRALRSAGALLQPTGDGSSAPCGAEFLSFPSARLPRRAPPHIRQSRSYRARAELRALRL
jgi:hypothetical protein